MSNYDNIPTQRVARDVNGASPATHATIEDIGLFDDKTRLVQRTPAADPSIAGKEDETVRVPVYGSAPSAPADATRLVRRSSRVSGSNMPEQLKTHPGNEIDSLKKIEAQDYPMGILVVISGAMQGAILSIGMGQNSIGRSTENRICMADDPYVSGTDHAYVTCRIDEGKFSIRPGTGRGIVYLNDEFLESSTLLNEGDIIRLTSRVGVDEPTQLMFIPIIRDSFRWPL